MRHSLFTPIMAVALAGLLPVAASAALSPYAQDFESLVITSPTALSDDGWLVYGNVFDATGTVWLYGYGSFPAPNGSSAFCDVTSGQGGAEQGAQQLVVYSDYNNVDHGNGYLIESNVFHEQTITGESAGQTWVFAFDAKRGNIGGLSTAKAFIKTLNPAAGWSMTNFLTLDMTAIPETWSNYSISIAVTPELAGQILQFGFVNTATFYEPSGIYYDNVVWGIDPASGVPAASLAAGAELRQNYPNPFNPSTRIDFALESPSTVGLSVYDLAGRLVATLMQGSLPAGEHHATWDGRTDSGAPASAGQYFYVLRTPAGSVARSMVLIK